MEIKLLEPAQKELDEAFDHYENQAKGLGSKFLDEILHAFNTVRGYPKAWPRFSEKTRRCLLSKFPYAVIYQLRQDVILIVAVAHMHREPEYWRERI